MESSWDTPFVRRLARALGATVLTAAGIAVSIYARKRRSATEGSSEASDDVSALRSEDASFAQEAADEVADTGEVVSPEEPMAERIQEKVSVQPLDDLTADELYQVAQRWDIAGRSTMRKSQLVEALQAQGIDEAAVEEPGDEEATAEDEAEEPPVEHSHETIAVRPLDDLTADELYRVAQRVDIAGRSTMRKAQLIEALQAEGIDEAEV